MNNYKRVTFSIPKITYIKLEISIPKNKRSKFVSDAIMKNLPKKEVVTLEEIGEFWDQLAKSCPRKTNKTAVELQREDRLAH